MDKKEIFEKIIKTSADVCNVSVEDILEGRRGEDIVTARAIAVFWAIEAGFSVESLLKCTDRSNANSINSIRAKQEEFWKERFAYHMLVVEVGKRLLDIAHSVGEDFDMWKPIRRMSKICGKY